MFMFMLMFMSMKLAMVKGAILSSFHAEIRRLQHPGSSYTWRGLLHCLHCLRFQRWPCPAQSLGFCALPDAGTACCKTAKCFSGTSHDNGSNNKSLPLLGEASSGCCGRGKSQGTGTRGTMPSLLFFNEWLWWQYMFATWTTYCYLMLGSIDGSRVTSRYRKPTRTCKISA